MDNATMESFNGRLRQECLNENWFLWRMHSAKLRPCAYTITRVVPILYWAG
ncbi:transposase [Tatumella sp. JGM100]|nr:transposase [Tatumella sp. JGM100]